MKKSITIIIITVIVVLGIVYLGPSSKDDNSIYFSEELIRAGVSKVGQPIEGFSATLFLEAFSKLTREDFDGVESLEGIYRLVENDLVFERTVNNPITSAEETISNEGYKTLLSNLSNRFGVEAKTKSDIAIILEKIFEEEDREKSYVTDDFSISYVDGWYPYENNNSVFFTHDENLVIPTNTDGFAIAPWFQITVDTIDVSEIFSKNLWVEGSEFLVSRDLVSIKGIEATRVVTKAAGADGEVLHYVFVSDDDRVFTLSHYPYVQGSIDTEDFEMAVKTFTPNYIAQDYNEGEVSGILPYDSGISGRVFLGPTCPVVQNPPEGECDDRAYVTSVNVVLMGSSKNSLFAIVETDKEGAYRVALPPGKYSLQAVGVNPFPSCSWEIFTVKPNTMHQLDLSCDTGIR